MVMDYEELLELVKTGEGYTLEFKESFSSSLGKELCAFANAQGGTILLGIKDDNSVKGFSLTNDVRSKIQLIIGNLSPNLGVTFEVIKDIGVIYVPEGTQKPYAVNGEFYLRQGSNSQKLTRDEILEFFKNSNKISFEKQVNHGFDLEKDFDKNKFKTYRDKAKITKTLSTKHILTHLNLLTEEKPNNACALLFPHRVTKFFLNGDISCVLYQGTSTAVMLDKKVFDADFISNFDNAVLFVLRNTRTKADIVNLRRVESPEIPENALREAIINAMIHKDYFIEGRVLIEIFSDRVAIGNPGKLLFNQNELGGISILRNPIIADCILRTELIEKIGSGIGRIKELVPNVKFEISDNWFRVVFKRHGTVNDTVFDTVNDTVNDTLTTIEKQIITEMQKNPQITYDQLESKIGKSRRTIIRIVDKLKDKSIVKREGSDKTGYWEVTTQ